MGELEGAKTVVDGSSEGGGGGGGEIALVLKMDLHCEECAEEVRRAVRRFEGVGDVMADCSTSKLTVIGNVNPTKIKQRLEQKTKKKVEIIFPHPNKESAATAAVIPQKKSEENIPPEENKGDEEKPNQATGIPKVKLQCHCHIQKSRKTIPKIEGVESVNINTGNDPITVKGAIDVKNIALYLEEKLKRMVEAVVPRPRAKEGNDSASGGKIAALAPAAEKDSRYVGGGRQMDKKKNSSDGGCSGHQMEEEKDSRGGGCGRHQMEEKKATKGGGGRHEREEKKYNKGCGGGRYQREKNKDILGSGHQREEKKDNRGGGGGGHQRKEKKDSRGTGGQQREEKKDSRGDDCGGHQMEKWKESNAEENAAARLEIRTTQHCVPYQSQLSYWDDDGRSSYNAAEPYGYHGPPWTAYPYTVQDGYPQHYVDPRLQAAQMFSDENPNACSIM
ncbi:hypothetical protein SAY86_005291 [Trapa natans]|uniref:HMA domain-containing protein n=1 Tax=Trapa natans TaxID=22666 RepID=A0AAN7L5B9_TRANT|nr:hypothetical protein SAY86_005291 [Trapa natans]